MNTKFKIGSLAFIVLTSFSAVQAATIGGWTFETSVPTTGGPLAAEVGSGTASFGTVTGSTNAFSNPVGNGSVESWSSNGWDVGEYFQFEVAGGGYDDFNISWSQTGSNTGPRDFSISYSLDGVSYTSIASYSVLFASPAWGTTSTNTATTYSYNLDLLSSVTGSLYIRLTDTSATSIVGGAVAAAGTSRVDNFIISDGLAAVPEPATYAVLVGFCGLAAALVKRSKRTLGN